MISLLPGWHSALSHHPAFVHFPIVLWLLALVVEVIAVWRHNDFLHRASVWLLWLGAIAATFAVLTGFYAAQKAPAGIGHLLEAHKALMLISYFLALALSLLALLFRRAMTYWLRAALLGPRWFWLAAQCSEPAAVRR